MLVVAEEELKGAAEGSRVCFVWEESEVGAGVSLGVKGLLALYKPNFSKTKGAAWGGLGEGELRPSGAALSCVGSQVLLHPWGGGDGLGQQVFPLPKVPERAGLGLGKGLLGAQPRCFTGAVIHCALVSLLLPRQGKKSAPVFAARCRGTAAPFCRWPHGPLPPCQSALTPWGWAALALPKHPSAAG